MFSGDIEVEHWLKMGYDFLSKFYFFNFSYYTLQCLINSLDATGHFSDPWKI